jgi:hypothetical protein
MIWLYSKPRNILQKICYNFGVANLYELFNYTAETFSMVSFQTSNQRTKSRGPRIQYETVQTRNNSLN